MILLLSGIRQDERYRSILQSMVFLNPFLYMYINKFINFLSWQRFMYFLCSLSSIVSSFSALLALLLIPIMKQSSCPLPVFYSFFCCGLFYCKIESNVPCLSSPTHWSPLVVYYLPPSVWPFPHLQTLSKLQIAVGIQPWNGTSFWAQNKPHCFQAGTVTR